jgi:hypothetical protein
MEVVLVSDIPSAHTRRRKKVSVIFVSWKKKGELSVSAA